MFTTIYLLTATSMTSMRNVTGSPCTASTAGVFIGAEEWDIISMNGWGATFYFSRYIGKEHKKKLEVLKWDRI